MNKCFIELKEKIKLILKKKKLINKKTAFFISNTAKFKNVPFYLTPLRETKNFHYFGITLFNDVIAKKICKIVDGKFNTIFVDTEKKSLNSKKKIILQILKELLKKILKNLILNFIRQMI